MPNTKQTARRTVKDSDFPPESPPRHLGIVATFNSVESQQSQGTNSGNQSLTIDAMPTLVDKDEKPVTGEVVPPNPSTEGMYLFIVSYLLFLFSFFL